MKAIDLQVHTVTKWGSIFNDRVVSELEPYMGIKIAHNLSDKEATDIYRKADVKVMLLTDTMNMTDIGAIRELNDRSYQFMKDNSDVIIGTWACLPAKIGLKGLRELDRCIRDLKFVGFFNSDIMSGIPINDKVMYYWYDTCSEAGVPVRIMVGHTAARAGTPGGGGFHLGGSRPMPFFDDIAADFPNLKLISAHCPWPYHLEMISIMLHKSNVYAENHGWAPKYIPQETMKEINGRLQDRFMFASDHPLLQYERVFAEWEPLLKPDVKEKMFYKNAAKLFGLKT